MLRNNHYDCIQYFSSIHLDVNLHVILIRFQELIFLVRDWPCEDEYCYGFEGGKRFMTEGMSQPARPGALGTSSILNGIRNVFARVRCFLMPEPSETVRKGNETNLNGKQIFLRQSPD